MTSFYRYRAGSRADYLDGLLSNASVAPSDDNDLPSQVRNVVDGELGLWSKVTIKSRVESLSEDAEGRKNASAKHLWRELRKRKRTLEATPTKPTWSIVISAADFESHQSPDTETESLSAPRRENLDALFIEGGT